MPDAGGTPDAPGWRGEVAFLRRTFIVAGVVLLLLFVWTIRDALLLGFAAVLVAVLVRAVAELLRARAHVPPRWSVPAAVAVVGLPLLLVVFLVGNEVRDQAAILFRSLPEAAARLEERFGIRVPVPGAPGAPAPEGTMVGAIAQQAASFALLGLNALGAIVVVAMGGIYIALDPGTYRRGLARLLPRSQAGQAEDALDAAGNALRLWLKAQLFAMAVVGTMTGLGAWAIGLPAPLALGLFAAMANIVPLIGSFAGAVPGLLLAVNQGWDMTLWAAGLYLVVQQFEGNILTPMIEQHVVAVPAALLLFSVVAAGAVLGLGGVLLAAPLTIVAMILVGKLYVRGTLGRSVEVPGETEG